MSTSTVDLGDVTIAYTSAGDPSGPLAILLHGFPDTNHTFRYLSPYLVGLGYHVVTPAMRGYAPSSLSATNDYHTTAIAHDVNQLH
jgi:pimeloyl-ACP methyl ester carboxylesterase